jgi:hypothetical protein
LTLHSKASPTRPTCGHCGAKYGQRDTHSVTLRWADGEPEPRYEGNLIVVKRKRWANARPASAFLERTFAPHGGPQTPFGARETEVPAQPNVGPPGGLGRQELVRRL